ncbi:type II CRISPR-associated endonuclease Cas1 [bacterium]|nr:type II CRISPR-associated endonuclease Cas1 [bacterium]
MTDRILDISQRSAYLKVRYGQLLLDFAGEETVSVPLSDIAVLVVAHPQVTYTQAVLAGLAKAGGVFVGCDEDHVPALMLLPLQSNYVVVERFARQAEAAWPVKKRLWQQIVRAKVAAQGELLRTLGRDAAAFDVLMDKVRSGDPSNVEAQASRRYWPALFGESFRRNREAADQNRLLNYGYAVLRATVARAVCAAGLHPALGLHHHNKYSGFPLADDLMEPFRPLVDRAVTPGAAARGKVSLTPVPRRPSWAR